MPCERFLQHIEIPRTFLRAKQVEEKRGTFQFVVDIAHKAVALILISLQNCLFCRPLKDISAEIQITTFDIFACLLNRYIIYMHNFRSWVMYFYAKYIDIFVARCIPLALSSRYEDIQSFRHIHWLFNIRQKRTERIFSVLSN